MAQNPMQDIVPKGGKTIRRIPVSENRARSAAKSAARPAPVEEIVKPKTVRTRKVVEEVRQVEEVIERPEPAADNFRIVGDDTDTIESVRNEFEASRSRSRGKKGWKKLIAAGGIVAVIALLVILSNVFHGATVTVTPKLVTQNIQTDLVAKKVPSASELGFAVVSIKQTGSETIKATGEKQVDKKATGTIIIYNNYNATAQRLIKNTRFATPEGLIFRITDSVTVPGKTGTTPGSVEATVVADASGDSYNVGLKDFTIPGFKGDPRYTTFYARAKTAIDGGFSGIQKVVADADRAKAKANIESKITSDLIKQIEANVTADMAYFANGYKIDFVSLPEESPSASEVTLKEEGTLSLVVFDKKAFGGAVAKSEISGYDGLPVVVTNTGELVFKPGTSFNPAVADSISFNLSGPAAFEWYYDEQALKEALAGKARSEIPAVLQKYPTIEKADISLRPFWSRTFPEALDKIVVKKNM
ncbi:MAG TPA: hypothetical protein VGE35_01610 [Candidatus Paceibacterota bacterium]